MPWEPQTLKDALSVLNKHLPREVGFPRTMPAAWRILLAEVDRLSKATGGAPAEDSEELTALREDITLLSADITALNQAVAKLQETERVTRVTREEDEKPEPAPKPVKKKAVKKTPKKDD